ncbi:dienelactone hydrolase family protein [Enterococcus hulanensis]|uniref:dienelactone hydrolase family protein n=1 Tax=Enterococcus hulanensis TaxID=2559929 RepID=UPI001A91D74F|nr:dienelactone hydrolase family protein [Enterococcus hulanensis]MBO0410190.1 dienelactone hydrolase family protein [Enterococcus hulanensis]
MLQSIHINSDTAIIVLHEIYGINSFIKQVCKKLFDTGYDIFCPNLLDGSELFTYEQSDEAYEAFKRSKFDEKLILIEEIIIKLKESYTKVFIIGYSVGATLAWCISQNPLLDGIVCYYGSRIRDYLYIRPECPSLLIFSEKESSFSPHTIVQTLKKKTNSQVFLLSGKHGFLDPFNHNYNEESSISAEKLTKAFLNQFK